MILLKATILKINKLTLALATLTVLTFLELTTHGPFANSCSYFLSFFQYHFFNKIIHGHSIKKYDSPPRPVLIPFTIVSFFHILFFKHSQTHTSTHQLLTYNIIYLLSMFIDFLSLFSPVEYKLVCFFSSFQHWFNLSNSSVLGTCWLFTKYILNEVSNIQFGNLARTFFDFTEADVG